MSLVLWSRSAVGTELYSKFVFIQHLCFLQDGRKTVVISNNRRRDQNNNTIMPVIRESKNVPGNFLILYYMLEASPTLITRAFSMRRINKSDKKSTLCCPQKNSKGNI